jgi:hypothetical protein
MTGAEILDLEYELEHYIQTALWSSTDDAGMPLDTIADASNIAPESLASMREDLEAFVASVDESFLEFWQAELGAGQVGHDFWLTRNGHGAGFWDRFSAGIGARIGQHLTEASRPFGESSLYVLPDGRIHVGG